MKKRLLILADLGHLKAFRLLYNAPGLKPKLDLIGSFSTSEASNRMRDKVTDNPGMFRGDASSSSGVRSSGERHNMELEFHRRAIKELAGHINDIVRHEPDLEECLFAATKEIHNQILEQLQPQVRSKIVSHWREDLTRIPNASLVQRVDEWDKQPVEV